MRRVRAAVIGAGHLGRYHAEKYTQLPGAELTAVVDIDAQAARTLAARCGTRALTDYREILGEVDAVSVVTPAATHLQVARDCLLAGADVLVEKPITPQLDAADALVQLAAARGRILQVGHLERFNPLMPALRREIRRPLFLECHRIAPYKPRGTDVDVLLDLMIHDIDLALDLFGGEVIGVEAAGAPVLSDFADIANARLRFAGGRIANLTASRISMKSERKLRVFERDACLSADLHTGQLAVFRRVTGADGSAAITRHEETFAGDALRAEIDAFLHCVRTREPPRVDGVQARRALAVTLEVAAALRRALEEMLAATEPSHAVH